MARRMGGEGARGDRLAQPAGSWRELAQTTGSVEVEAVDCQLPIGEIYEDLPA
jgi:hypothetical protein